MALLNYLKVLRALQKAEIIKRNSEYCLKQREKNVCDCKRGELCQRALAFETGLSDNAIKNMLLRLEYYKEQLGDDFPFSIRVKAEGGNFPRKFIKLR